MFMVQRLFAMLAMVLVTMSTAIAQPKLEIVGGESYDWGKTRAPKEGHLEAEIKMKNVGNKALRLTEVRPGCGCTKTDPDKFDLKPGEVSTMKVKLNISPSQAGSITKNITVSWADLAGNDAYKAYKSTSNTPLPEGADTTIRSQYIWLKADIQRALMFQPSMYFSFQDLKVGQEQSAKVEITNNSDEMVVLSDWTTDGGLVINQTSRVSLKPKERIEIIAKVVPMAKGNYAGGVRFKTSHSDHTDVDLRAYGFVQESQSPVFQGTAVPAK
jgi:uncharacterized protein (DUF58 family)